jgi:hypothetical protein
MLFNSNARILMIEMNATDLPRMRLRRVLFNRLIIQGLASFALPLPSMDCAQMNTGPFDPDQMPVPPGDRHLIA